MTPDELYQRWATAARRTAARRVDDADAVDEAVQETLSALALDPHCLEGLRDPATWVAAVARKKAIGVRRRLDTRSTREVAMSPGALCRAEQDGALLAGAAVDPAEMIVAGEWQAAQREAIAAALAALPPKLREAVVARLIEGRSYEAIATDQGVSPALVRQRVKRGRTRLVVLYRRTMDGGQLVGWASLRELIRRWRERARAATTRLVQPLDALAPTIVAQFDRQVVAAIAALGLVLGTGPSELPPPIGAPPTASKLAATSGAPRSAAAPVDPARQSTPPHGRGGAAGGRQIASVVAPLLPYAAGGGELTQPRDDDANPALHVRMTVAGQPVEQHYEAEGLRCTDGSVRGSLCTVADTLNTHTDDR